MTAHKQLYQYHREPEQLILFINQFMMQQPQPFETYDIIHNNDNNIGDADTRDIMTTIASRPRRRGRRARSPTTTAVANNASVPWQAMKRLRVDANASISTFFSSSSMDRRHNSEEIAFVTMMRTSPENTTTNATATTSSTTASNGLQLHQQQEHHLSRATSDTYDNTMHSYHCYQRHQRQETGQYTEDDGWSSPEQQLQPPRKPIGHHYNYRYHIDSGDSCHSVCSGNSSSNHATTTLFDTTTATTQQQQHEDEMEYQNVNHILGNLHFERQQRNNNHRHHDNNNNTVTTGSSSSPTTQSSRLEANVRFNDNRYNQTNTNNNNNFHEYESLSEFVTTAVLPPVATTPLNSRILQLRNLQHYSPMVQQPFPSSLLSSPSLHCYNNNSNITTNNNILYQTPPPKPTKRKIKQLHTNSKLG